MRIDLHVGDGPVPLRDGTQLGEGDGVIPAEADRHGAALDDARRVRLDARQRLLDVAGDGRGVARIDARQVAEDHLILRRVVRTQQRGGRADRLGTEARARAERRAAVPRHAEDGGVGAIDLGHVRKTCERAHSGEAGGGEGIGRLMHGRNCTRLPAARRTV